MNDEAQIQGRQEEWYLADPLLKFFAQEWMSHVVFTLATGRQDDATLARSEALLAPDERMRP
jgi:hypothetical protein